METNIEIQNKLSVSSDSTHHKCLNCNNEVADNFCSVCGQKKSTHRYSLEHFFVHDLVHGVFHVDKGFLFTIKELFTRPGHSMREFIEGKRANHFNYFSFALIILVIEYYLTRFSSIKSSDLYEDVNEISGYQKVAKDYYKIITLAGIPLFALASYFVFKRSKLNYTEHLIINLYRMSVAGIIMAVYIVITIFYSNMEVLNILFRTVPLVEIIYTSWFFHQYFSVFNYNKWGLIFRSILTSIILIVINNGLMKFAVNEIGKYFFK